MAKSRFRVHELVFLSYLWEQVDAIKRSCIKGLPHTLVIHLKRFEFDYETMTRWKIKDR